MMREDRWVGSFGYMLLIWCVQWKNLFEDLYNVPTLNKRWMVIVGAYGSRCCAFLSSLLIIAVTIGGIDLH